MLLMVSAMNLVAHRFTGMAGLKLLKSELVLIEVSSINVFTSAGNLYYGLGTLILW